jgi:hypothetical protein
VLNWLYRWPTYLGRCMKFLSYGFSCVLCAPGVKNFRIDGGSLTGSRRAFAKFAKRQMLPVYSPRLCHYGGASRVSRRFFARKILNMAAVLGLPAIHFGGNFLNCVKFNALCNTIYKTDFSVSLCTLNSELCTLNFLKRSDLKWQLTA